jgi:hypothetical protein
MGLLFVSPLLREAGSFAHAYANLNHLGPTNMDVSSNTPPSSDAGSYRNKREVPRFGFIATVDLREPTTDTRFSGRISEISRKGCYVDVLNTLPVGTVLEVRISRDCGVFESQGKIIYVQPGMGMGVAFLDLSAAHLAILDSWLAEISA